MSISGTLIGKAVGIVAGVGLGGLGAYNYMSTGCVTGLGCSSGADGAAATLVSQDSSAPACTADKAAVQTVAAEAPACTADKAAVQTVAAEAPACTADKAAVQTVAAEAPACTADKASCGTDTEIIAEGDSAAVISNVSLDSTEKSAEQCENAEHCDEKKAAEVIATTASNNE